MAAKKQQTHAKRARELAIKERRERKRAKKAEAVAQRQAGNQSPVDGGNGASGAEGQPESATAEWVQ